MDEVETKISRKKIWRIEKLEEWEAENYINDFKEPEHSVCSEIIPSKQTTIY